MLFKEMRLSYMKKESRDFSIIFHINSHYEDLKIDINSLNSFETFVNSKEKRRAILFDFLQIGELAKQLSKTFIETFNDQNLYRLISIRNRIVHGYSAIRDDIIYNTIKNDLPSFLYKLNRFAREYNFEFLRKYLGKRIRIIIDRPIGYKHDDIIYEVNYGYFSSLTALDGMFQDAYVLGEEAIVEECRGKVIAIVHRFDDIEDKLVISTKNITYSVEEIEKTIAFQERFFKHEIILL